MLMHHIGRFKHPRCGRKTAAVGGVAVLLTGLVTAWGIGAAAPSLAQSPPASIHSSAEQSTMTSPYIFLVQKLSPAVVNVRVDRVAKTVSPWSRIPEGLFRDFFGRPDLYPNRPDQGAASGVLISSDGYILTNNHVVENAREVSVTLDDRREFKARIIGKDAKTDLAVLKIDAGKDLPAAVMGDSERLMVGEWVLAVGNPFGLSHTVTSGIVSAKGRVIGAGPYDDFIQTDASINPGNSGGPLFNMRGEVVGINTAIIPHGQGIGFAIPINTAKPLIPQLVEKGTVTRGFLGVSIQSVTPDLAEALKISDGSGALVTDVIPDGPGHKAGIRRGDVIISYDGRMVRDSRDLPALVAATPVGKEVRVTVVRDGGTEQVIAKIAKLDPDDTEIDPDTEPARGKWGLQLQDLTPDAARRFGMKGGDGAVVVGVQPGSSADKASIRRGDIILEVNRQPVGSAQEAVDAITGNGSGNRLLLLVRAEQGSRYVVLKQ